MSDKERYLTRAMRGRHDEFELGMNVNAIGHVCVVNGCFIATDDDTDDGVPKLVVRPDDLFVTDADGQVWEGTVTELASELRKLQQYRTAFADASRKLEAT